MCRGSALRNGNLGDSDGYVKLNCCFGAATLLFVHY
jgi:hypothetical protein